VSGRLFQLERADDGNVNRDFVVALMKGIDAELQELDEADLARQQFLKHFANNFGLSS